MTLATLSSALFRFFFSERGEFFDVRSEIFGEVVSRRRLLVGHMVNIAEQTGVGRQ